MTPAAWFNSKVPYRRERPITIPDKPGESSLVETELVGMGACLIERWVFEKLNPPWFTYTLSDKSLTDEERISEDFWFSWMRLWKELGFHPLVDTSAIVGHMGSVAVYGPGKVNLM